MPGHRIRDVIQRGKEGVKQHVVDRGAGQDYQRRQDGRGLLQVPNKIGLDVALEALRDAWIANA